MKCRVRYRWTCSGFDSIKSELQQASNRKVKVLLFPIVILFISFSSLVLSNRFYKSVGCIVLINKRKKHILEYFSSYFIFMVWFNIWFNKFGCKTLDIYYQWSKGELKGRDCGKLRSSSKIYFLMLFIA